MGLLIQGKWDNDATISSDAATPPPNTLVR